jgi:hypothetical protein
MAILILEELLYGKISITSLINIKVYFLLPQIACETILFILVQILVVHSLIQRIEVYIDISEHLLKDHKIKVVIVNYQNSVFAQTFLTHLETVFIQFVSYVAH